MGVSGEQRELRENNQMRTTFRKEEKSKLLPVSITYRAQHTMKARGSGTPGRAAASRVNRVLHPAATRGKKKKKTEEEEHEEEEAVVMTKTDDEKRKKKKKEEGALRVSVNFKFSELVRAVWHAFPGCLALWLYSTFFTDRPFRTWRAHPVAIALLPLTAACWCVEWLRLTPSRC